MYITGKILVKCVSKNYQRYLFSKYLVCVQERALGETRRKILRCLFPKQTSNVQTGIYIYIYIYINIYIIYIYIYIYSVLIDNPNNFEINRLIRLVVSGIFLPPSSAFLMCFSSFQSRLFETFSLQRTPCFGSIGIRFRQFLLQVHINSSISPSI